MEPNGVIIKNVANLHAEKDTDSERVTQAIMGQPIVIEKEEETSPRLRHPGDKWLYVQTWDTYHGWIQSRWVTRTVPKPAREVTLTSLFTDAYQSPNWSSEIWTKLVITTTLELLEPEKNLSRIKLEDGKEAWVLGFSKDQRTKMVHVRLPDGKDAWVLSTDVRIADAGEQQLPLGPTGQELIKTGKRFLGVPYLWGGTSPFGLDCSGFVQLSYKLNGMGLLRDADIQASDPRTIPVEKKDLMAGDMVFFAGGEDKTKITHIGMAIGDGTFIHSSGGGVGVTINNLTDDPFERNYWGARRMDQR